MNTWKISKLQVTNFRNLSNEIFTFSNGINCILGENGNGKTNLLEAVNVLTTKKSFKKNTGFPQYLSIDSEKAEIIFSSVFENSENEKISYSSKINNTDVLWFLDGAPIKKKIDIALIGFNDDQNKFDVLTTGTLYIDETTNLRERLGEINNYENVLLFDYLRSLTDPKDELRREIEAYGFKESQDFTYPNIGPVRVFVKSQSLIGISF